MKKPRIKIKAEQLVLCNVLFAREKNIEGRRNTIAIKGIRNSDEGYDLVTERYIPFRKEGTLGVCMDIINVPFEGKKNPIDIDELDLYLEKYRKNINNEKEELYNKKDECFQEIKENILLKKNPKKVFKRKQKN